MEIGEGVLERSEEEMNAKAAFAFKESRKKVTHFSSHFVVDAELGFMVRKKLAARTPKGFQGYVSIEGRLVGPYRLYTVLVGFYHPISGVVACGFPVYQAGEIEKAITYAKLKEHKRNLKRLVNIL